MASHLADSVQGSGVADQRDVSVGESEPLRDRLGQITDAWASVVELPAVLAQRLQQDIKALSCG